MGYEAWVALGHSSDSLIGNSFETDRIPEPSSFIRSAGLKVPGGDLGTGRVQPREAGEAVLVKRPSQCPLPSRMISHSIFYLEKAKELVPTTSYCVIASFPTKDQAKFQHTYNTI